MLVRSRVGVPLVLLLLALFGAGRSAADSDASPSLAAGDPFPGLYAAAEVFGSKGRLASEVVSLAGGRVRLLQVSSTARSEQLAIGSVAYEHTTRSLRWAAAPPETAALVRAHDVHRALLARDDAASRPARIELPAAAGQPPVTIDFADWRDVHGVALPFRASLHIGEENYLYRYTAVLPFRPAPGVDLPASPKTAFARLGDMGSLVAAHEQVMVAHRKGDAELLASNASAIGTVSGRGELSESARGVFLERMRAYLGATRFDRYEDTELPVVAVSVDGTMGWVACEIEAQGVRKEEEGESPVAFGFSWVELYARARATAAWVAIGNASSERPGAGAHEADHEVESSRN